MVKSLRDNSFAENIGLATSYTIITNLSIQVLMHLLHEVIENTKVTGADLGTGCRGCAPPPEMTCGF